METGGPLAGVPARIAGSVGASQDLEREEHSAAGLRGTAVGVFGVLLSRVLGLVRDALTARYFPPEVRDAFVIAFRLPNAMRRIFGEGAFSGVFVPTVAQFRAGGDEEAASRFASAVFAVVMTVATAVSLLGIVFMEPVLRALLGGEPFMSVPGKFELSVHLARIMFGFLGLATLFSYFVAALHASGKFALAAFAPVVFNLSMISATYAKPLSSGGAEAVAETIAETLAWSVLAGGILQALIVLPAVLRTGLWPRRALAAELGAAGRAVATAIPIAFGSNIFQFTALANLWFASRLPQGSHSHLYFADRILELPLSMFAASLGAAILPEMARYWAEGRSAEVGTSMNRALRAVLFIAVLNAVGMIALAEPIVDALFVGREFSHSDGAQTARILQFYSGALVAAGVARILLQGFYAARLTRFPAIAAGVSFVSHLVLAGPLSRAFGIDGVAGATVISQIIFATLLALGFQSRVARLDLKSLGKAMARLGACAGAAAIGAQSYIPFSARIGPFFPKLAVVIAAAACAGGAYVAMAAATRSPELREFANALRVRARKPLLASANQSSKPSPHP